MASQSRLDRGARTRRRDQQGRTYRDAQRIAKKKRDLERRTKYDLRGATG